MGSAIPEPASFRDPDSSVFYADGRVLRGLSEHGASDWRKLAGTDFFPRLVDGGQIVRTLPYHAEAQPGPRGEPWSLVLDHERIPVVSYPFEWPFAMLREAATCHLEVLLAALDEGITTKDGAAYNVPFVGSRPIFIDLGSFEGYRLFLRVLSVTGHLGVVPVAQHPLRLATGVPIYVVLRRLGAKAWMAALGGAPVLLDVHPVYLEQFILAQTLIVFLVVGALVALLWADGPPPFACAAAGALIIVAALTRTVGILLLVPAAAYLVLRRLGIRRQAFMAVPAGVLLGGYAPPELPLDEQALCDQRPPAERPGPDWYSFMPGSRLRDRDGPRGTERNMAGSFTRRVIRNRPGDHVGTVAVDLARYFSPSRATGPRDYPAKMLQFRTKYTALPWKPLDPPADPCVDAWTWPGPTMSYDTLVAAHGFATDEVRPLLDVAMAQRLRSYQRNVPTPGPVLGLALGAGVLAGCGHLPAHLRLRWAALTFAACGFLTLLVASATVAFDYRFLMPTLALLPPAGVIGATLLERRLRT